MNIIQDERALTCTWVAVGINLPKEVWYATATNLMKIIVDTLIDIFSAIRFGNTYMFQREKMTNS